MWMIRKKYGIGLLVHLILMMDEVQDIMDKG